VTSRLGTGMLITFFYSVKARPLKTATHENVKCTDDLSYVFLKLSLVAETRTEPLSRIASLLLHSWHRSHFSSPLIFIFVKGRVTREVRRGGNRIGLSIAHAQ
jgi:hypothetical protein